jgi:hypothetical protein
MGPAGRIIGPHGTCVVRTRLGLLSGKSTVIFMGEKRCSSAANKFPVGEERTKTPPPDLVMLERHGSPFSYLIITKYYCSTLKRP